MTEIERLALAINPIIHMNEDTYTIREMSEEAAIQKVRALLTALREPSEGMVIAALQELPFGPSSPAIARNAFTAAIDVLLSDGAPLRVKTG